jgi:hypothetical protein
MTLITAAQISYFAKDGTHCPDFARVILNTGRTVPNNSETRKRTIAEALGDGADTIGRGASRAAYGIADRILEVDPRNRCADCSQRQIEGD